MSATIATVPNPSELQAYSTADLRDELARGLTLTADTLTRLGLVWAELERRGEDLSDLRHGLAKTLPKIAAGQLAAEAVVAFAGKPIVLRALTGMPLDQQRRLAAGELLKVIDPAEPTNVLTITLDALPASAVRMVFADGEIRSPSAQRLAFRARRRKHEEPDQERRYQPRYDPTDGTIAVGKMRVKLADLLGALAAAAGPDRPIAADLPTEYVTIRVRLSHDERLRLSAAATKAELPDWELVRKAIRAFGLI